MNLSKPKVVDLSHPFSTDSWPFPGDEAPYFTHFLRLGLNRVFVRRIHTNMHVGTHIDAPLHMVAGPDMAEVPLDRLYHWAAIADVSDKLHDLDILYPEHVTEKVDVKEGDILIIHYGWHKYYQGAPEENEEKYSCYHPGPNIEFGEWAIKKKLRWVGVDAPSTDHPMNNPIRLMRPDVVKQFEKKTGKKISDIFRDEDYLLMHYKLFPHGIITVENVGGDIKQVLNRRLLVGAFPIKWVGGDGSLLRLVAFLDEE